MSSVGEARPISVANSTVLQRFEQQVGVAPQAIAIHFEDRCLTYAELDELATRIALSLTSYTVKTGQSIGLCMERCPAAIAAMLAVFKVGGLFVPLDPDYPAERIRFMIEDAQIGVVLTHNLHANPLASCLNEVGGVTRIDCASPELRSMAGSERSECHAGVAHAPFLSGAEADALDFSSAGLDDLAYIMYTSGSSGQPKGVQIDHRALATYCLADANVYRLEASDRTLQFSTLNFDIAIEEIFPPLTTGGSVVVRPSQRAAATDELSKIVDDYAVTAVHLATAYWHEWVDLLTALGNNVPSSLRLVIVTGEKVSTEHFRRWQSICKHDVLWCNAYGPTECTVTSTVYIPPSDFNLDNMPIGKPLPGYQAHILDDALQPVAVGETGQLFISGPALARGYLNRPEKNANAFVEVDLREQAATRLYRTGDLARWLPDGNIDFAGRADHQIKLGSYRIEPGEIEAALNRHPRVRDSIVLHAGEAGQKHLIAYLSVDDDRPTVDSLAQFLRSQLPAYMLPARYVMLDRLPTTINGKVDRAALTTSEAHADTAVIELQELPPRSELEQRLARIWQQVLHVPSIGVHDDFFALGGSSLLVARVVASLKRELSVELPVRDFFAHPTLAGLARHLRYLLGQSATMDANSEEKDGQALRKKLPSVVPKFISNDARRLFSVSYSPPVHCVARRHAVLLCNAYGHENTRAYRNLQQLGLQLAVHGFHVLRFDYHGSGNSSGACDEIRAETLQADTRCAARALRETSGCGQLSVVGIRLGATIAATAGLPSLEHLILWDPVVDGGCMLQTFAKHDRYQLESQTRFLQRRKFAPIECRGQLYGHATSAAKIESIGRLHIPAIPSAQINFVLASRGYRSDEPGMSTLDPAWNVVDTNDDIHWHDRRFTESAFAAPESARRILKILQTGFAQ